MALEAEKQSKLEILSKLNALKCLSKKKQETYWKKKAFMIYF